MHVLRLSMSFDIFQYNFRRYVKNRGEGGLNLRDTGVTEGGGGGGQKMPILALRNL